MTKVISASIPAIEEAAEVLKRGGLVAMPTETVYGLAANAFDGAAVARVFEAKGRPEINPLIVHVSSIEQAMELAVFNSRAEDVAHAFWPGPLTLVLPRRKDSKIAELAMAGLDTIALRMPAHKMALGLIKSCGFPLVAPSANKSGTLSPTTPAHVADSLGKAVDMILAAGSCEIGVESTVLDLSGDVPVILRPGSILAEEISDIIDEKVGYDTAAKAAPSSPGQLLKHYKPDTPLRLNAIDLEPGEALLAFGSDKFMGIKGGGAAKDLPEKMKRNLSAESDLNEAAANLFAMLKELDKAGAKCIAVMAIPDEGLGIAINDRLRRAAS